MDNVEHAFAVQQLRKSGKNAKIVSPVSRLLVHSRCLILLPLRTKRNGNISLKSVVSQPNQDSVRCVSLPGFRPGCLSHWESIEGGCWLWVVPCPAWWPFSARALGRLTLAWCVDSLDQQGPLCLLPLTMFKGQVLPLMWNAHES